MINDFLNQHDEYKHSEKQEHSSSLNTEFVNISHSVFILQLEQFHYISQTSSISLILMEF